MKVAFVKDNAVLSFIIRTLTRSKYHHCGAVTDDGLFVIEAIPFKGVVKTPIDEFERKYTTVHYSTLICNNDKAFKYLDSRIGNGYDWLIGKNINKDSCGELIANASGLFRKERTRRISLETLWVISK